MNGNIFSDSYVKEKLNRLQQINSQKRLKVQQATQAKKPQMSRVEYEKYKKIIFEQNKKPTIQEEKVNDIIPTKDNKNKVQKDVQPIQNNSNNNEQLKLNKSLERNRSPKPTAGQIVFAKRSSSIQKKDNLNSSEIIQKSPKIQTQKSPKNIPNNTDQNANNRQKLKQSKSLMKLSNTMNHQNNEMMSESQMTQEIPNSSRTQNVLQNMKSILSIGSPQAYFSNATSTLEDPNLLEQTTYANNKFFYGNQRHSEQIYTPAPISPGHNMLIYNDTQGTINNKFYPTYQTQQSVDFMNSDNPEFLQFMKNQNKFMRQSQVSNLNDGEDVYQQFQYNQQYPNNYNNEYISPEQQYIYSQQQQQPTQSDYQSTIDQKQLQMGLQNDLMYEQNNQFTSPRTNHFQRQQLQGDNKNYSNEQYQQQQGLKRLYSQPDVSPNHGIYNQQQGQYYQSHQHERKLSSNSYQDHTNNAQNYSYQNSQIYEQQQQHQQYNNQPQNQRNSYIGFDDRNIQEEQEYLQGLNHLGVKEDLDQSEILISQLKQNQSILNQEKQQLERELADLENKTRILKSCHKKQYSLQYTDTSSQSIKTGYLEASFKKQPPNTQHYVEQEDFFDVGFEKKWEQIEKEEEETEKSFMIISEYLNMQSEQGKNKKNNKQMNKDSSKSATNLKQNYRKNSEEYEKKSTKNNDQIIEKMQQYQNKYNGEKDEEEEDMEWLDGIEESFCELKSINKNELMPQFSELQSCKKSYLQKYQQDTLNKLNNNNNNDEQEDDAYLRLKNQIIGKLNQKNTLNDKQKGVLSVTGDHIFQKSNGSRGSSLKGSNAFEQTNSEVCYITKEMLQDSSKGTRSPQFGASGKINSGFSYLNDSNNKDILKKESSLLKGRITSSLHDQTQNSHSHSYVQDNNYKKDNSQTSPYLQNNHEDQFIKNNRSTNNLINNFYNEIQEIQQKNNNKFQKTEDAIVLSDRNIQKSNEIIDKINQKYQNNNQRIPSKQTQKSFEQDYDVYDEDIRQQQYIMKKLNEIQNENTSQTSSLREKDLQYSQTISSYLAQGESQLKKSSSFNSYEQGIHKYGKFNQSQQQQQQQLQSTYNNNDNKFIQSHNNKQGQSMNNNNLNEELQVVDLNSYSSFKNDLQSNEQQPEDLLEDQYFKFSNHKNNSFEREIKQMQQGNTNNDNNNQNNNQQDDQEESQNNYPFKQNEQNQSQKYQSSQQGNSTSLFQKKLNSQMESFYKEQQQQDETSQNQLKNKSQQYGQKNNEGIRNIKSDLKYIEDEQKIQENDFKKGNNNQFKQNNKIISKPNEDLDNSLSSGDELEETILSKLQKLKKKRESNSKEKSPLSQNSNIANDFNNTGSSKPFSVSSGDKIISNNLFYEQINKENNQNNQQNKVNISLLSNMSSLNNSNNQRTNNNNNNTNNNNDYLQKMQIDDLFNKSKPSQEKETQNQPIQNKANSTRDKISSIQQKLNNLFEKKNAVQTTKVQQSEDNSHTQTDNNNQDYPRKSSGQNIKYNNNNNNNDHDNENYNMQDSQKSKEPRIDRKVIDNLAEEVEMLMKMQNLENQYKDKDYENKQLKQEYIKYERRVYDDDGDQINLDEDIDFSDSNNNQSESQMNFYRNKQQLPLYEIEEEHSIDNSIVDQNFQIKNQYH